MSLYSKDDTGKRSMPSQSNTSCTWCRSPIQLYRQNQHDADLALQYFRRNDGDVKGETVLHLRCGFLVLGVDVQDITVHLVESHASKQPIERGTPYDKRHPGRN